MKQPDENNASSSSSSSSSNKPENNDIVSDSQYLKTILPSGYKFNPLDQELILDYLVPKLKGHKLPRNLMHEVDFYKYDPDYLSAKYEAQGPRTWYFFTSMVKLGSPQNRNTENGYWKITGKKETINYDNDEVIGLRRNLEFYIREKRGGVKTKWLMHEFVVEGQDQNNKREKNLDKVLCKLYTNDRKSSNSKGQEEAKKSPDKEQESNLESDGNNNDSDTPPTKRPHHHHNNNQHVSYKECLKNHAASIGGHALDGCREFMVGPNANPLDPTSLTCAACGCHRNFHRRDPDDPIPLTSAGGGGGGQNGNFQSKKSYRTKFSQEQKEKMYALSEKIGWKLKKSEESLVEDFCKQVGVDTTVFRFWMQNNKHSSTTSASAATPSTPRMRITTGIGILGNNNNTTNSANNSNGNSISK